MNEKTTVLVILSLVAVTAVIGLFSSDSSSTEQATGLQIRKVIAAGSPLQAEKARQAAALQAERARQAARAQAAQAERARQAARAQAAQSPPKFSCTDNCRIWNSYSCGGGTETLVVNGKEKKCVKPYDKAPGGTQYVSYPYCGKTSTGQNCDPYGRERNNCVCRSY